MTEIVATFGAGNREELGLLTGASTTITSHPRLLRSLSWGDEDYADNVLTVLREMTEWLPEMMPIIDAYLDSKFPGEEFFVSAKPAERKITFAPNVFQVPELRIEPDLVAVMMPSSAEFHPVYEAIKGASKASGLRCLRADDLWEESTIVQDIFNLIFRAQVVVVDFTGKNPNVMYETGIAHTLGKHVVPITQNIADVPSDAGHHRALRYLRNTEGLATISAALAKKLSQFGNRLFA